MILAIIPQIKKKVQRMPSIMAVVEVHGAVLTKHGNASIRTT
jgi:hypothetical protein